MPLFRKKKKEDQVFDPETRKASPAGSGKLEPEEKLILVILFYLIARWILRF